MNLKNLQKVRGNIIAYDYYANVKDDVLSYINDEIRPGEYWDRDELESYLNDELFCDDNATGNGCGSYTRNRSQAKEYVLDNADLLKEGLEEFDGKDKLIDWFFDDDYESMDVVIRCYVLGSYINDAFDEIDRKYNDFYGVDREDDEE